MQNFYHFKKVNLQKDLEQEQGQFTNACNKLRLTYVASEMSGRVGAAPPPSP